MRFKVVLALCATVMVVSATAQAGWWHRHHRCPHCSGYGGGTVGVASSGGEFSSASGEAYVVRTVPERVRYYAVSDGLIGNSLDFRSTRSAEEAAKEAAHEEIGRIEAEKVRVREAAREAMAERFGSSRGPDAETSREADITTIVQGISMVFELLERLRGGRGLPGGGGDTADCEQRLADLQRQLRNLERNPSRRAGEDGISNGRTIRRSFNPGRENSRAPTETGTRITPLRTSR